MELAMLVTANMNAGVDVLLKTWCSRRSCFQTNWTADSSKHSDDTTQAERRHVVFCACFFVVVFFTLERTAITGFRWVEFFPSVEVSNSYMDRKISPEPPAT